MISTISVGFISLPSREIFELMARVRTKDFPSTLRNRTAIRLPRSTRAQLK